MTPPVASRRWSGPLPTIGLILVVSVAVIMVVSVSWPKDLNLDDAATNSPTGSRVLYQSYLVDNVGSSDVRITGLDADIPRIKLESTNLGRGIDIAAHHARWLRMTFRVIDCHDPPYGPLPVQLRISRWYGTQTMTEQDHGTDYDDAFTACGN